MESTALSGKSQQLVMDVLPDLDSRLPRFTVLSGPADPELQHFFINHLAGVVPAILAAIAKSDMTEVTRQAHVIKGVGGSVGFPEISALSERMEEAAKDGDTGMAQQLAATLAEWLAMAKAATR